MAPSRPADRPVGQAPGVAAPHELLRVGSPQPDLETSPIVNEEDADVEPVGTPGMCRYNGATYGFGERVLCGSEVLRCEAPGLWVREGELRPKRHL